MNADTARALFDRALDGELDPETQAEFEATLEADAGLRAEYSRLEELQRSTGVLAQAGTEVDLLAGVQEKLRARSGGKFYRDRFAEQRGRGNQLVWLLTLASVLVIAVAVWYVLSSL